MKLSKQQISEIRDRAGELSGPRLRAYFATVVGSHGISESELYRLTQDLRKRKKRWDAGTHRKVIPPNEQLQWMSDLTVHKNLPANRVISQAAEHFGKQFVGITVPQYNSLLRKKHISLRYLRKASDNKCFAHEDPTYHWRLFYFTSEKLSISRDGTVVWRSRAGAEPDSCLDRNRGIWIYAVVDCRSSLRLRWAYRDHNSFNVLDFMSRALKQLGVPKAIYADEDPVHTEKI